MSRSRPPWSGGPSSDRGISPVLGITLLVAITIALVFALGAFLVGVGVPAEEAPTAVVEATYDAERGLVLHHRGGDVLAGGTLVVRNRSAVLARATPSRFAVAESLAVSVSGTEVSNSERIEVWWIPEDESATGITLLSTPVAKIDGYDSVTADATDPWEGQAIFALDDAAGDTDARHRAAVHLESGDAAVGDPLGKVKVYYQETDVSNVEKSEIIAIGLDTDGDGEIEQSVKDDVSGVKAEDNGYTLTVNLGGSYSLEAGDTVVVRYGDVTNPAAGEYTVEVVVNPQSGQTTDTGTLEIEG